MVVNKAATYTENGGEQCNNLSHIQKIAVNKSTTLIQKMVVNKAASYTDNGGEQGSNLHRK